MAERSERTRLVPQYDDGDGLSLGGKAWQLALWAGAAMAAVGLACAAAYSGRPAEPGPRSADSARMVTTTAERPGTRPFDAEIEAHRLSEAINVLAADRDRLQVRVSALERSLDDITGSIATAPPAGPPTAAEPAPAAAPPAAAPPAAAPPVPAPPLAALSAVAPAATPATARQAPLPAATNPPARTAVPPSGAASREPAIAPEESGAVGSVATKTEFGVDLGGATTVGALRALWQSLHDGHEALLEGLRPLMAVREGSKPGTVELRLVAGPVANAGAAARLCAALTSTGLPCQASIFDGQRLALK